MYVRGPPPAALWVAGLGAPGAIGELHSGELGDRREPELVGVEIARPVDVVRGDGGLDHAVDQHGSSRPWSATLTEVADTGGGRAATVTEPEPSGDGRLSESGNAAAPTPAGPPREGGRRLHRQEPATHG